MKWAVTATWKFSLEAIKKAAAILEAGGAALDAAEAAAKYAEEDAEVNSVGLGGLLTAEGRLELDAAVMDGSTLGVGAVGAVAGYVNACRIARIVMEHTRHNIIAGEGAAKLAAAHGMAQNETATEYSLSAWKEFINQNNCGNASTEGHDTIGVIALDSRGNIACATSTSGLPHKLPGRVGDSPVIGSGFYADSHAGGAVATGVGEDIMRCCVSYEAVRRMEEGDAVAAAAESAMRRACGRMDRAGRKYGSFAILAMDAEGNAAASTNDQEFHYSYASDEQPPILIAVNGLNINRQSRSEAQEHNFNLQKIQKDSD